MLNIKKSVAAFLIVCLMLPLAACNQNNDISEATSISEAFCADLREGDSTKLISYFDADSITEAEIDRIISPVDLNQTEIKYLEAVKNTITYTVQEPVYDKKAGIATVYTSWSMVDCSQENLADELNPDEFLQAISESPKKIVTVKLVVDLNGETKKITNPKEALESVYAYTSEDHKIMSGKLSDYFVGAFWAAEAEEAYKNIKELKVNVHFNDKLSALRFVPGVTYEVLRDDELLYKSEVIRIEESGAELIFDQKNADETAFNEDEFLVDGAYKFIINDEYCEELAVIECNVVTEEVAKEVVTFKDLKKDFYLSNLVFDIKDSDMLANAYTDKSGWWDYDSTSVGKSAFGSDTKTIGFSLSVDKTSDTKLYYDYYYCKDSNFKDISKTEPVFSSDCIPTVYDDQACYDLDYTSEKFEPGFYGVVVYADKAKKHIIFTAACIVVKEASSEIKSN